jgi:DNA-binding MarR family transcriptional regulator
LLIFDLQQQLAELLRDAMVAAPLRPTEFALTSVLYHLGPQRPGDLVARTGMRPSSMSNYLRRLTTAGLIRRKHDPLDGRAALISLTPKGRRATEGCFPYFGAARNAFYANLAEQGVDHDVIVEVLEALSSALRKTLDERALEGLLEAK